VAHGLSPEFKPQCRKKKGAIKYQFYFCSDSCLSLQVCLVGHPESLEQCTAHFGCHPTALLKASYPSVATCGVSVTVQFHDRCLVYIQKSLYSCSRIDLVGMVKERDKRVECHVFL
jgi:hypothetical protein